MFGKRKRKLSGSVGNENRFVFSNCYSNWVLLSIAAFCLLSEPISAAAWLSKEPPSARQRSHCCVGQQQRLYSEQLPQPSRNNNKSTSSNIKFEEKFEKEYGSQNDLDSLRAHAAKLRAEAESLETALEESKEQKIRKEIDKVDGWIDDLLIEVTLGDGTELLKTVDQVQNVLQEKRYSARHVLKIFDRLCYLREQESRSNCSPLMELLVDATGKLDCVEREDNPNKRWNYKVERVLRRKLFARDWNIEYVSEDEKHWY